jgi:hypothetical protein
MNRVNIKNKIGRLKMKKVLVIVMVLMVGIMFVNPTMGYSNSWDRGRGDARRVVVNNYNHYDRQPARYDRSRNNNDGLLIAGIALGGIALGAILGSAMSQPRTVNTQQAVYNDPVYSQPAAYGATYNEDTPPGQWVMAPGQWINGQWVAAHKVWVPVNP